MGRTIEDVSTDIGLDRTAIARLRKQVSGRVLESSDAGFDDARQVWNGMIDKRPLIIVQATDEIDVQCTVAFARDGDLPLSIKGGGHNVAGNAVCDGGVMLDLGAMSSVEVDPDKRTARVEAGALWSDVDAAAAEHGLATTGGVVSSTGVAGLTLGGGIGWLVGKHGMSIDNLRSATVVTSTGEIVTASDTSHPDLFWAIRGGGGNFGVATTFEFALHPLRNVLAGFFAFPTDQARQVLGAYRDFTRTAPDELTAYGQIGRDAESGERVTIIAFCWPGDIEQGERIIAPMRSFGTLLDEMVAVMPYPEWQQAFDAEFPTGRRYYWKGNLMHELADDVLDAVADYAADPPLPWSAAVIEWYRGPMNRVDPTATAFAHRDAHFQLVMIGAWDDPADDATGIDWTRRLCAATAPYSLDGSFLSFNTLDGQDRDHRVRAGYGENWDRLGEIKRRYDPENLFRQNNNILPG